MGCPAEHGPDGGEERMAGRRVFAVLMAGALMAACAAAPSKDIKATLEEWKITLNPTAGAAGEVTFTISNQGEKDHEFVIVRTDLAPDNLPTVADGEEAGTVDEEGAGIEAVDELEDIKAGTDNNVLTVTLTAGNYVIFCNVHDQDLVHCQKGMHTAFSVS
jgi:uncharacterized cupredoxin-like copper-binding protein